MKKQFFLLSLFPLLLFAQNEKEACETLSKINALIQSKHYKPKAVDDSLSIYVYDTFLNTLDEDNRLFTEIEINSLQKHKLKIDDYILQKNCDFLNEFHSVYNGAIQRYKNTIEVIKEEPFSFSSPEYIEFSKKNYPYAKDDATIKSLYKKRLLFHTLRDISEISKNKDSLVANFDKISKTSKEKIFETFACKYSSYELSIKDFYSKFFVAFCSYFDPHTEYLSESDKSSFLSNVSPDNLTFGMIISMNEKDEIVVDEVVPGSSAYFTERIEDGDQIIKIKYLNDEYTIACSSLNKVEAIFTSSEYKNVDFTLRKKSGEIYTVSLTKKVMKDYENNVYSFILEKDKQKIGYIKIPSFYATFENGKTNVSDDVIKEIYKLQEDDIDGLIIDLQNNGGGSMDEAIKLTSAFIDYGPIAIMNTKQQKKETIKDHERGCVYIGPMVVLINGFSASASEFFTNAMQDYNRAIIVGNQSYGKASMQRILPLNYENQEEFVKLTIEEFYRITGKSNQTIGITPDVEIPSLFNNQMPRESEEKTAIKNDTINSILRYTQFPNPNKNSAIEKSKSRVKANEALNIITSMNEKIDAIYNKDLPPILLEFNSVFKEVNKMNSLWASIKDLSEKEYPIKVERNSIDMEYQQLDDFLKSSNTEKIKAVKCNLHIIEAMNIINDLKE